MNIASILSAFLVLSYCSNPKAPKGTSEVSLHPRYNSYQLFIDSLIGKERVIFNNTDSYRSTDTFRIGINVYKVVNRAGHLKLNKLFFGVRDKQALCYDFDSCHTSIQLGEYICETPSLPCSMDIACVDKGDVNFEGIRFIYCIGTPSANCIGSVCRVIHYPVFAITRTDTSLYIFSNADDITGLRYGDFNVDNNLDFLVVNHGFSQKDIATLINKDKNFKYWECRNSQCYKITALTFANGNWKVLKDIKGEEYYFLIKLDDPLNPNSSFEILDYSWM